MATITFIVKVSGGKFYIDEAGNSGLTLTWRPGDTYIFDQADSSNAGNTLRLSATSDNSGSSEYTTGVTVSGTAGSSGAKTTIITSGSTTATLYYYSGNNSGYGGTFSSANYNTSTNFNLIKPQVGKATGDWGPMVTHALDQIDQAINNITAGDIADATLVTESEGLNSSDNDTSIPTTAAVKDYVDSNEQSLSLIDEDSMSTDSATRPPSQQSVKAYVNAQDALVEAKDALMGYQGVPHIIPGVLYPGISDKQLDGTTALAASTTGPGGSTVASSKYGTVQSDGRMYYYTDIKGSKPIKDPRIGGHFGSQRHAVRSIQILEQETATHGSNVYSVDGREWFRAVGPDWLSANNAFGNYIYIPTSATTGADFVEIVGYFNAINMSGFSGTIRDITLAIDGTANSSNFTGLTATVDSPISGSRYVDGGSAVNLTFDSTPSLGIHTVKIGNVNGDYLGALYSIELITQDTSNRNNIQIPSQDVVSYGKKFTVSGTPHYDPFNGFVNGTSLHSAFVDTGTSLGLDTAPGSSAKWAISSTNNVRPYNGGRVVKWIDSSGVIKTSVNMMPPNAQNIAGSVAGTTEVTTPSATNTTPTPIFSDDTIDHSQAEVAKTFHAREFGNGSANEGTGGANYADASMLNTVDDIAYVMDDGLTSLSGDGIKSNSTQLYRNIGSNTQCYVTFIGTGIGKSGNSHGPRTIAQNLPYGTHIFKQAMNGDSNSDWYIDGVQVRTNSAGTDYDSVEMGNEFTFYQPKRPPIPEDACVIADYMLMADYVPSSSSANDMVDKGVRRLYPSRDVFYDTTIPSGEWDGYYHNALSYSENAVVRMYSGDGSTGETWSYSVPSFCSGVTLDTGLTSLNGINATTLTFNGANPTTLSGTIHNDGTVSGNTLSAFTSGNNKSIGASGCTLGLYVIKGNGSTDGGTTYNGCSLHKFDIATPIHTSSHYQTFETPFLHELIGGDRNMEQTNLVVSPDGKTWDQISRDTSYMTPDGFLGRQAQDTNTGASDVLIWTEWRGNSNSFGSQKSVQYNKNFAIAYDRVICLKDGLYQISSGGIDNNANNIGVIQVNGDIIIQGHAIAANWHHTFVTINHFLKRGDYIQINGLHSEHNDYSKFEAVRLK